MPLKPDPFTPPVGVMLDDNAVRFTLQDAIACSVDSPWAAIAYSLPAPWSACYPFYTPELAHD